MPASARKCHQPPRTFSRGPRQRRAGRRSIEVPDQNELVALLVVDRFVDQFWRDRHPKPPMRIPAPLRVLRCSRGLKNPYHAVAIQSLCGPCAEPRIILLREAIPIAAAVAEPALIWNASEAARPLTGRRVFLGTPCSNRPGPRRGAGLDTPKLRRESVSDPALSVLQLSQHGRRARRQLIRLRYPHHAPLRQVWLRRVQADFPRRTFVQLRHVEIDGTLVGIEQ